MVGEVVCIVYNTSWLARRRGDDAKASDGRPGINQQLQNAQVCQATRERAKTELRGNARGKHVIQAIGMDSLTDAPKAPEAWRLIEHFPQVDRHATGTFDRPYGKVQEKHN